MNFKLMMAVVMAAGALQTPALATDLGKGHRIGLGQAAPNEPAKLGGLRLTDPLIQQKYMKEPDLLRFLRATYSEACTRGMLNKAAKEVKMDPQRKFSGPAKEAAATLLDGKRIFKMTSFEMESVFGRGYLQTANYCDCIMLEVTDADLVDPTKTMDVVEKLPDTSRKTCERLATELTDEQLKKSEVFSPGGRKK